MTKDYDEYKADEGKHKALKIILKAFEIVVIVGCVLAGIFFLLMVAFPKGLWVDVFK
jgi:hypothetical protein